MGDIYRGAHFVIAAHGGSLGLKRERPQPIFDPNGPEDEHVYCRMSFEDLHKAFFSEPMDCESWFGRSWCMQERLFAKRILYFGGTKEECVFEGRTSIKCECGKIAENGSKENSIKKTLKMKLSRTMLETNQVTCDELWRFYIDVCEDYSARGLTFGVDTLPAISSVMNTMPSGLREYYAGIWEYGLLLSLQWEAMKTEDSVRQDIYVAPSWSWASRRGAVMWYMHEIKPSTADGEYDFASIINVSCTLATADLYGKVSAGYLTLEGFMTEMRIESVEMLEPDGRLKMIGVDVSPCYATLDSMQDVESVERETTVFCLDIMRDKGDATTKYVSALVLLKADTPGKYRRIGFSTMKEEHFKHAERLKVSIV